jgi:hypothetical protein
MNKNNELEWSCEYDNDNKYTLLADKFALLFGVWHFLKVLNGRIWRVGLY